MKKSEVESLRLKYEEAKRFAEETAHEAQNAKRAWQEAEMQLHARRGAKIRAKMMRGS
jgi:hypothetical protein